MSIAQVVQVTPAARSELARRTIGRQYRHRRTGDIETCVAITTCCGHITLTGGWQQTLNQLRADWVKLPTRQEYRAVLANSSGYHDARSVVAEWRAA